MNNCILKFQNEDLQNIRFLSDHEMVMGDYVLSFSSRFRMYEALYLTIPSCAVQPDGTEEFEY